LGHSSAALLEASFWVLFLSLIIDGASGGNIATAQAVMADITTEEDRAKGMGMIGAAFGLGFILGPAIGGILVGFATWLPGVAAATTSAIAFVLVVVRLPETRSERIQEKRGRGVLDFKALRLAMSRRQLALCLVQILIVIFAFANFETTFAQFAKAQHGLTISQIAYLFVYAGVLGAIIQGGLVGRLARRFGEARLVVFGAIVAAAAMVLIPVAERVPPLLGALALLAVGHGFLAPSLSSLTSKLSDPAQVGAVMGFYQSLSSLGRILGPFWGEWVYGTVSIGSPFRSAAAAYGLAAVLALVVVLSLQRSSKAAALE
jgi:DHA1 family tetracycline resistance protein-like MFS transporter